MFTETPPECNTKLEPDRKDALKNNFHRKDAKNAKETGTKEKKPFMSFETWIVDTCDKSRFRTLQVFCRLCSSVFLLFFAFFASLR
jgi:hypothetical protein